MALVWLLIGVGLALAEVFTTTFVLLMLAGGALAAAAAALAGLGVVGQGVTFTLVSALALVLVRPVVRRHAAGTGDTHPVGVAAIEGSLATVLEQVDAEHGLIKIDGEMWQARPCDSGEVIPEGARVRVVTIEGATALVWRD